MTSLRRQVTTLNAAKTALLAEQETWGEKCDELETDKERLMSENADLKRRLEVSEANLKESRADYQAIRKEAVLKLDAADKALGVQQSAFKSSLRIVTETLAARNGQANRTTSPFGDELDEPGDGLAFLKSLLEMRARAAAGAGD